MKKVFGILAAFCFLTVSIPVFAYNIDGDLSDWGVTEFIDWTPDSPTADFVVEDDFNRRPPSDPFNEAWDIEAMYFDDDDDYLYFGLVSSNAYEHTWASEDLGIDLNGDGFYEFGLDVANVQRGALRTRNVFSVDRWWTIRGVPYRVRQGTDIGDYEIYNRYLGQIETDEVFRHTFALEARIPRALFGDILCGQEILLHMARVTCVKDVITLEAFCDDGCDVIPEPATLLLLGSGLLGLAGLRSRKKNPRIT